MVPMKPEPRHRDPDFSGTLSLDQLARRWNTSRKEIRRMLARQQLDFIQIRGRLRVALTEVQRHEEAKQ